MENGELVKLVYSFKEDIVYQDLQIVKSHNKSLQKLIKIMKSHQLSTAALKKKSANAELSDDLNRLKFVNQKLKTTLDEKKLQNIPFKFPCQNKGGTHISERRNVPI